MLSLQNVAYISICLIIARQRHGTGKVGVHFIDTANQRTGLIHVTYLAIGIEIRAYPISTVQP